MILIYILMIGCLILALGIVIGSALRMRRIDRQNEEMEAILKKYGKDKTEPNGGNTAG